MADVGNRINDLDATVRPFVTVGIGIWTIGIGDVGSVIAGAQMNR